MISANYFHYCVVELLSNTEIVIVRSYSSYNILYIVGTSVDVEWCLRRVTMNFTNGTTLTAQTTHTLPSK